MSDDIFELTNSVTTTLNIQESRVTKYDHFNEDLNKQIQILEKLRIEQMKYSLVCDSIKQYFKDDLDNQEVCKKVHEIIDSADISQYLCINSKGTVTKNINLLGLSFNENVTLSFQEQETIRDALEIKLIEKVNLISKDIKQIIGNYEDTTIYTTNVFNFNLEDKVLLDFKQKLKHEMELYIINLMEQAQLLEEIVNVRATILPKLCENTIRETIVKYRMHDLKTKILNEKLRVDIFTETNTAIDAYKILIIDIKNEQRDCKLEINNLIELKEQYKQVSCKEFDEILKRFLQFKLSVDVMKDVYDKINSK